MKRNSFAAICTASLLCTQALLPMGQASAADTVIKVEFENGTLTNCTESGTITKTQIKSDGFGNPCDMTGWSGDGYVFIDREGAAATVNVTVAEEGLYTLNIGYIQCSGTPDAPNKTQYLLVNGESQGEVLFPFNSGRGWEELTAGHVNLKKGENEITIKSYWGYTYLDYLAVSPAPSYLSELSPAESPCNPNASPEARKLYAYLRSVYGKQILSGQQEKYGSHCTNKNAYESQGKPINYLEDNETEFTYIQEKTGKQPAIRGIDFLFYNTTKNYADDAPERVIAWYKEKGGIPTVTFHWNVPTDGPDSTETAFYVESTDNKPFTTFSITNAVTEGTWEHEKIDADIALLAEQLGKTRDAGVPILFRPLHEAEGGWFWWGAEGAEPCKKLYRYLWDQLTNVYGLDNLLWTWTGSSSVNAPEWYPGDEYVDFIGIDKYNAIYNTIPNPSALSAAFYTMADQTKGQKMVCMSENDTIPSLENLLNEKAYWLYFCPWYERYLIELNDPEELSKIYNSEYCITLDELPDWDTYDPELPEPVKTTTTTPEPQKKGLIGDANCDDSVDVSDAVLIARFLAEDSEAVISEEGMVNADCDSTPGMQASDVTRILKYVACMMTKEEFESKQ